MIDRSDTAAATLVVDGRVLRAAAVDEHRAQAAAGITMVFGTIALVYSYFDKVFWPIRVVSAGFFVDFLVRVTFGLERSPVGVVAGWLTRWQSPQWVSAKPKRFAWSLGLGMALVMAVMTNSGVRGPVPRSICMLCIALMWLEAVLGLCLGCELYGFMVRRGWRATDDAFEVCNGGACEIPSTHASRSTGR